jgi:hypothetical protein
LRCRISASPAAAIPSCPLHSVSQCLGGGFLPRFASTSVSLAQTTLLCYDTAWLLLAGGFPVR